MSWDTERTDRLIVLAMSAGANEERRRIRRLIASHLEAIHRQLRGPCQTPGGCQTCVACKAIDAATKAPRKARKGK